MSAQSAAPAEPLRYVDPAEFTPYFSWHKSKKSSDQSVFCEHVALAEIANTFATPAYVYSEAAIKSAFRELHTGLGALPHTICFAVKSNGNLTILKHLAKLGSGFDVVSGGELEHLGHLGIPGEKIVFSGVGKTREEIREALQEQLRRRSEELTVRQRTLAEQARQQAEQVTAVETRRAELERVRTQLNELGEKE